MEGAIIDQWLHVASLVALVLQWFYIRWQAAAWRAERERTAERLKRAAGEDHTWPFSGRVAGEWTPRVRSRVQS